MSSTTLNRKTSVAVDVAEMDFTSRSQSVAREEIHQLLVVWNQTFSDFPKDRCVHDLFAEQVAQRPNAQAVAIGDERLTYAELDSRANQVAHYLQTKGVGPEVVVGLCIQRSLEMIIGL